MSTLKNSSTHKILSQLPATTLRADAVPFYPEPQARLNRAYQITQEALAGITQIQAEISNGAKIKRQLEQENLELGIGPFDKDVEGLTPFSSM